MADLAFETATELARMVRSKEVSPIELTQLYLDRIDKLDPELNSYVTVSADDALQAASVAEQRLVSKAELPPFHGVPITIKDLNETAGIKTTFSCKLFADYIPDADAATVRRIKDAGFIVLGKTNTPEFGTVPQTESELNGICRNPWDVNHTPGGSSGGAAAGLAAGLSPIAQGSDGGGSIRIPASCCGLFGIKPSRGRVSGAPRFGNINGLSTDGPIARSVLDAAALLDVMAGYEPGDPYWLDPPERPFAEEAGADPGRLRIAFTSTNANDTPVDEEVDSSLRATAGLLESLGHVVEERSPEWDDPNLVASFITVWQGVSAYFPIPDASALEPVNRILAESGIATSMMDFIRASVALQQSAARALALWDDYDVVLTPTMPQPPAPVGWIFEEEDPWNQIVRAGMVVPYTAPVNASGQPAVSLPLGRTQRGLPIGMQLIGRPADEATLVRVSTQLEVARPWADHHPPIA